MRKTHISSSGRFPFKTKKGKQNMFLTKWKIWLWVNNGVTPKWLALVNGTKDDLTWGPNPGGLFLTHTHIGYPKHTVDGCEIRLGTTQETLGE